jgi:exonuclease VII small subunit
MADQDGLNACKSAYQAGIAHLNQVLITNLTTATAEDQKQAAIAEFKRGVQLCKEARGICEESFS